MTIGVAVGVGVEVGVFVEVAVGVGVGVGVRVDVAVGVWGVVGLRSMKSTAPHLGGVDVSQSRVRSRRPVVGIEREIRVGEVGAARPNDLAVEDRELVVLDLARAGTGDDRDARRGRSGRHCDRKAAVPMQTVGRRLGKVNLNRITNSYLKLISRSHRAASRSIPIGPNTISTCSYPPLCGGRWLSAICLVDPS
jgi:hypothetical protein